MGCTKSKRFDARLLPSCMHERSQASNTNNHESIRTPQQPATSYVVSYTTPAPWRATTQPTHPTHPTQSTPVNDNTDKTKEADNTILNPAPAINRATEITSPEPQIPRPPSRIYISAIHRPLVHHPVRKVRVTMTTQPRTVIEAPTTNRRDEEWGSIPRTYRRTSSLYAEPSSVQESPAALLRDPNTHAYIAPLRRRDQEWDIVPRLANPQRTVSLTVETGGQAEETQGVGGSSSGST